MRDYRQEIKDSNLSQKDWYRTIYLFSDHWRDLRIRAFAVHGRKCHNCQSLDNLDVHHLNYRSIYDVTAADLQVLCRACHMKEHEMPEKKVKPLPKKPWTLFPEYIQNLVDHFFRSAPAGSMKSKRNRSVNLTIEHLKKNGTLTEGMRIALLATKSAKKARALRKKRKK